MAGLAVSDFISACEIGHLRPVRDWCEAFGVNEATGTPRLAFFELPVALV